MFKKEDFDITFRVLRDYNQYDVVLWDADLFELDVIIESFISRGQLDKALQYLKYDISYATLNAVNTSNKTELKRLIFRKCNDSFLSINGLSERNPSNKMEYGILIRYLENLTYYFSFSPIKTEYIPDTWISIYNDEYKGSLSRRTTKVLGKTIYCRITSDAEEYPELIGNHGYQLHTLIGVFYALGFMKKMGVTDLKNQLSDLSYSDFGINTTSNYIKTKINPTKYREQIKSYLDILSRHIQHTRKVELDEHFKPNHCISRQLISLLKEAVDRFENHGGYQWTELVNICFNVIEADESYFQKELGFLAQNIDSFVSSH